MAKKVKCSAKFGAFRWNRDGYAEVMNSDGPQELVRQHAQATLAAANASFTPSGDESGYALRQAHGRLANGCSVGTTGIHSRNHNAKHNTLLKALQ